MSGVGRRHPASLQPHRGAWREARRHSAAGVRRSPRGGTGWVRRAL